MVYPYAVFLASLVALTLLSFASPSCCEPGRADDVLLEEDFEHDPLERGWRSEKFWDHKDEVSAEWVAGGTPSGKRCVKVSRGMWVSAPMKVEPLAYYRVRFASNTRRPAVWIMRFFDEDGLEIAADCASGIDASKSWADNESMAMAREGAVTARVCFIPMEGPLEIDDVVVTRASRQEVLQWADALYALLPSIPASPQAPGRWKQLPETMRRLREGKPLRIVALGASIGNDICNSHYGLLIERMYPEVRVVPIPSIRSMTAADFYEKDDRVREYVLDYEPDLLTIDCYKQELPAIRSIIRQVRKHQPVEVLVTVVCGTGPRSAEDRAGDKQFMAEIAKAADEDGFGVVDIRSAWERYVATAPGGRKAFSRDDVHYNDRGKQIVGRMMAGFFAPETSATTTNE